jgi:hypothetical protein
MRKGSFVIVMIVALAVLAYAPQQAAAAGSCTGICYDITSPYVIGAGIAAIGVILVVAILAMMYMLSPAFGNTQMRTWIRTKVYDELASLVLIFIFIAFGALVATLPVYGAMNGIGLVSSECGNAITTLSAQPPPPGQAAVSYDNLYFLSVCDTYQFNQDVQNFATSTFYVASLVSLTPTATLYFPSQLATSATLPSVVGGGGVGGIGASDGQVESGEPDYTDSPGPINTGSFASYNIGLVIPLNFMPIQPVFHYFVPLLNSLYLFFILSQVQLMLISASGIIYAILMAVGLIARSFGVTRTFGGALIAFALGIGIIYPLMTAVTLGFLTHALDTAEVQFCQFSFGIGAAFGATCPAGSVVGTIVNMIATWVSNTFSLFLGHFSNAAYAQSLLPVIVPLFRAYAIYGAFVAIGLTFLPLLSLTVVDVFIVDFSTAIGERMDFLSLLTRLV